MATLPLGFGAIVLLLVGSLINAADAAIHVYGNKRFTKISNGLYVPGDIEALYASKLQDVDAASSGTNFKGKSVILFDDITFVRTKEAASKPKSNLENAGLVETLVFEVKDRERIGGSFLKSDVICCTQELADAGSCNLGEVIIQRDPSEPDWPKRIRTFFEKHREEVKMSPEALVINKTGLYTVYFMTCDQDLDGTVVRGRSVWKNLGGYLPGETAPLLKFYGFMFLAYVVLGLVWFPQVARYWKDGIQLHSHVSLVIAFSMGELALLYFDFAYLDSVGTSPIEVTLWAVTFSSARKALSRLLLLVITSGYGIVKPDLSGRTLKMLLLGVMCFVISVSLGLAQQFGGLPEDGMTLLMLSWAILETCFLHWIFRSLWNTLKKLKVNKRNIGKLELYKNFAVVLVTMVVLNFAWIYVEVYVYDSLNELWQVKWMIPGFWYVLAYALMVVICFFWPPNEKPTRYLYVAEMEEEYEEEEEDLVLAEAGMKSEDGSNVERDERKSLLEAFILLFGNIPRES
uniref:Transmembrane protein 87A n=1 Tax=Noccaea caerulescens TaxID=107243 RepID=A0A1J3EGM6_NOCCA